ncbi:MAG: bifunctional nuclease family protein [Myxococcota bacterium]|nr:bifunctional nuclease family protein [Myxococcota bacterium]MDW8363104.1 bifunctional nuclease family protein [Myxococcales bacterium]
MRGTWLASVLTVGGCGGAAQTVPQPTPGTVNAAVTDAPQPRAQPTPTAVAPAGYVRAAVAGVAPDPTGGHLLLLVDEGRQRALPVGIGAAEAMVIDLRLRGERYERPLTHDLLDSILRALGARVVMVQVNKLRSGIFVGSVFVWDGRTTHRLDSRTSDAVCVALGHDAPIFVADAVFEEAGMPVPAGTLPGL